MSLRVSGCLYGCVHVYVCKRIKCISVFHVNVCLWKNVYVNCERVRESVCQKKYIKDKLPLYVVGSSVHANPFESQLKTFLNLSD